jgi:glycosyltransferase involved in cell wall biosynthesis
MTKPVPSRQDASAVERLPIVAMAPNSWLGSRMNRQHILSRLAARGWTVLYSTGALSISERHGGQWDRADWFHSGHRIEGVWVDRPGRCLPRWRRNHMWDRLAIRQHARWLKSNLPRTADGFIAYVFHPFFWHYIEHLSSRFVVYHAYDAFDLTDDWSAQLEQDHARLARRADLRIASSSGIAMSFPEDIRESVRVLPNGADVDRFISEEGCACPADLANVPQPRIGYAGAINPKLDFKLIADIAKKKPEWHWVLIGRIGLGGDVPTTSISPESWIDWQACKALPNVHYLGEKSFETVPKYLHHMDVNVMIYRTEGEGWWLKGSPLKIHEQLAVARPVVGAALEAIVPFSDVLEVARTSDDWIAAIARGLDSGGVGTSSERRAVALRNSWNSRVDLLESWLLGMIHGEVMQGLAERSKDAPAPGVPHK